MCGEPRAQARCPAVVPLLWKSGGWAYSEGGQRGVHGRRGGLSSRRRALVAQDLLSIVGDSAVSQDGPGDDGCEPHDGDAADLDRVSSCCSRRGEQKRRTDAGYPLVMMERRRNAVCRWRQMRRVIHSEGIRWFCSQSPRRRKAGSEQMRQRVDKELWIYLLGAGLGWAGHRKRPR